jgi:tetratricopeptide (TPR) repeat protein
MGTAEFTISSLEKIAFLSGRIRNLPSWHHFSIAERVRCLRGCTEDPTRIRRHNRFVGRCVATYLILLAGAGYLLNFSDVKQDITIRLGAGIMAREAERHPADLRLQQELAMLYHELGDVVKARRAYERVLAIDPDQPAALNNLAWLLVTAPDASAEDRREGMNLAKRAVAAERSAVFLDTLAEAYWVNGFHEEAARAAREALGLASNRRAYYRSQLHRFLEGKTSEGHTP